MEGFYTIAEFLRLYGVGRTTAYRLAQSGALKIIKVGRASRIAKADAAAWAASLPVLGQGGGK